MVGAMKKRFVALNRDLAPILAVMAEQKGAPLWVELIPAGDIITGRDGRTWTNPNPDQIVDEFELNGADLPIDVEHSTELKGPNGDPAPAVAWIKALEVREGGAIWGLVEWVDHGRWMVDSKEYRYLSPVFLHKKDGEIVKLKSAGLTNNPNLHLTALNQSDNPDDEADNMDPKLLALLGLAATATVADAETRITALNAQAKQVPGLETSLNAAKADAADLEKFVPRADHDVALNRASEAETKLQAQADTALNTAIETAIAGALEKGVITPATADYHKATCQADGGLDRFNAYVEAAPVIGGASGLDDQDPNKGSVSLNQATKDIAVLFGNTEEDLQKYAG